MGPVQGLDHVIVLVRDLDAAEESLARLGFKTTPRGFHSEVMGTANATAVFRNETYVELMTVLKETPLSRSLAESQKAREGVIGRA